MPSVLDTAGVNANKFSINTSDAGRELVVSLAKSGGLSHDDLLTIYRAITQPNPAGGVGRDAVSGNVKTGPDAFTFAGFGLAGDHDDDDVENVGGTTSPVFLRVQGTGAFTAGADFAGVTGVTATIVAIFQPRL